MNKIFQSGLTQLMMRNKKIVVGKEIHKPDEVDETLIKNLQLPRRQSPARQLSKQQLYKTTFCKQPLTSQLSTSLLSMWQLTIKKLPIRQLSHTITINDQRQWTFV